MRWLRSLIYRWGFRPRPLTITGLFLYSPSLEMHYLALMAHEAFKRGFEKAMLNPHRWTTIKYIDSEGMEIQMNPCKVKDCAKVDDEKPMCFRRTDWCSERHRKIIVGELPAEEE